MKEHHVVKFQSAASQPGEPPIWKYGIAVDPRWDKTVEKAAANGLVVVDDAVLPTRCLVAEKDIVDLPFDVDYDKSEMGQYLKAEQAKAEAIDAAIPEGAVVPGRLLGVPVADGHAFYVVTAVSPKGRSCTIEWRGYDNPDRYVDHRYGWRCKETTERVARLSHRLKFPTWSSLMEEQEA